MITSPLITHISWGRLEANGQTYKDAKLYPGGVRAWDWNEYGTRHTPGIQPADVQELIDHGATIIILSRGVDLALHTMPETLTMLEELDIETHVLQTEKAVENYNQLAEQDQPVAALIHSTC